MPDMNEKLLNTLNATNGIPADIIGERTHLLAVVEDEQYMMVASESKNCYFAEPTVFDLLDKKTGRLVTEACGAVSGDEDIGFVQYAHIILADGKTLYKSDEKTNVLKTEKAFEKSGINMYDHSIFKKYKEQVVQKAALDKHLYRELLRKQLAKIR